MPTAPKENLSKYIDKPLDPSGWVLIDQDRINSFADATLDHQFIHVDEEKAAQTPFGTTIAHGYLIVSLISHFLSECGVAPDNTVMGINYGLDKVRFLQTVLVNSQVRGRVTLNEVTEKAPGQLLAKNEIVIEIKSLQNITKENIHIGCFLITFDYVRTVAKVWQASSRRSQPIGRDFLVYSLLHNDPIVLLRPTTSCQAKKEQSCGEAGN